jgi:C-terminal processing protease CtpA/Prc
MKSILIVLGIVILSACSNGQPPKSILRDIVKDNTQIKYPPAGDLISVKDLKSDLAELNTLLDSVHPDPSFTMNLPEVKFQINKLAAEITTPMTHLEAWKYFSVLNPYFQDGHMVISYPEFAKELNHHINNGGRIFPIKVRIDKSHHIYVTDVQNIDKGIKVGDKIVAINGIDASEIVKDILNRMHGDTVSNRLALISERFANMYWLLYGDTDYYQIDVSDNSEHNRYSVIGSNKKVGDINPKIGDFVQREILANGIGYLRIDRFYYTPEQETAYFKFMDESWQKFHNANVQDVIIDVRNNPGGTDHYWQLGIAPYIAREPFSFLSAFKIRLTEGNLKKGPVKGEVGSMVEGPYSPLVPIKGHNNLRIPGKAYLLMGSLSYSSTILFLTALQDSKQAVIAGQSSGARSCTTGRIETSSLSGSKLKITLPTLIFIRPSGKDSCHQPIKPDLFILDDPSDPIIAVNKLAASIISRR